MESILDIRSSWLTVIDVKLLKLVIPMAKEMPIVNKMKMNNTRLNILLLIPIFFTFLKTGRFKAMFSSCMFHFSFKLLEISDVVRCGQVCQVETLSLDFVLQIFANLKKTGFLLIFYYFHCFTRLSYEIVSGFGLDLGFLGDPG